MNVFLNSAIFSLQILQTTTVDGHGQEMADDGEAEDDGHFERPPFTDDLRQILAKYPDGGQILKVKSL